MNRYFDFPDEKITMAVDVKAGSPAARAPAKKLAQALGQTGAVREIELREYVQLTRIYEGPEPGGEG
jgi:hypothetical protein